MALSRGNKAPVSLWRKLSSYLKILLITLGATLCLVIAILLLWRYVPVSLPLPSGSYQVGRVEFDFTDVNRVDSLAPTANTKRELAVWVWYPANPPSQTQFAPYLPEQWANALNESQGFNILGLHSYTALQTHSIAQAALASTNAKFPLIIFEPGLGLSAPDYTVYEENLASHGYVVVGITPTYSADVTTFSNGKVVAQDTQGLISSGNMDAERLLAVWSQDVEFVMGEMENLENNPTSMFYSHLDTADIGVFGHSFGGATALEVCLQDSRCKAGADIDGMPYGASASQAETKPLLFITHDYQKKCSISCSTIKQVYENDKNAAYEVSIAGTNHLNYSDAPLQYDLPVDPSGNFGSIDKYRALEISIAYLVSFFDRHLKNIPSSLLSASANSFPEATIILHN